MKHSNLHTSTQYVFKHKILIFVVSLLFMYSSSFSFFRFEYACVCTIDSCINTVLEKPVVDFDQKEKKYMYTVNRCQIVLFALQKTRIRDIESSKTRFFFFLLDFLFSNMSSRRPLEGYSPLKTTKSSDWQNLSIQGKTMTF